MDINTRRGIIRFLASLQYSTFIRSGEISMSSRREFIVQLGLASAALSASQAWAQGAMLAETDAQAAALGYKADAGPCPLFPGKQVSAKGWCSAWAKKA
jgi:hypothetical protein